MSHMGHYDSANPADQSRKGWLTSILELGAWFGTLLSGFMAEAASRKYGILIATGMFSLHSPILQHLKTESTLSWLGRYTSML